MRSDDRRSLGNQSARLVAIRVQRTPRGRWEVILPGRLKGITCETLDDARRVAYLAVAHTHPCELIVHDAYHRVVQRERIDGYRVAATGPELPGDQHERSQAHAQTPAASTGRRRKGAIRRRGPIRRQTPHQGGE